MPIECDLYEAASSFTHANICNGVIPSMHAINISLRTGGLAFLLNSESVRFANKYSATAQKVVFFGEIFISRRVKDVEL